MDRRRFLRLTIGTVVVLPVGRFLVQCGGYSSTSSSSEQPAAPPMQVGSQIVYTSSVSGTHSHTVSVSMAMLGQVKAGDSVAVTTGVSGGHTHVFTFVKLSGVAEGEAGGVDDAAGGSGSY